jgi:hypothetical protein
VADDRLAAPEPSHQPCEVLHLCGGDRGQAEGLHERCDAAAEAEGEPAFGQSVHGGRVRRCHERVARVVVGGCRGDVDPRGDGADCAGDGGCLLEVEALGDERPAELETLGVAHLGDEVAR